MPVSYSPIVASAIGVLGAVGVAVLAHQFSRRREAVARQAVAATKYRRDIAIAIAHVPALDAHWNDMILSNFQQVIRDVTSSSEDFKYFIPRKNRILFENEVKFFKHLSEKEIPKAILGHEILYGHGPEHLKYTKKQFYTSIENLLSYAKQT